MPFFCQLRPDCGSLLTDVVVLCLGFGEGFVRSWYGLKGNTFEGRLIQGMTVVVSSSVLLHFKASYFLPQSALLSKYLNIFLPQELSCTFVIFPQALNQRLLTLLPCTVHVAGGLAGCTMGGSAAPGWSLSSLHSQSRSLAGYF